MRWRLVLALTAMLYSSLPVGAQETYKAAPGFLEAIVPAQAAVKERRWADALKASDIARLYASTPKEMLAVDGVKLAACASLKDTPCMLDAINAQLANPELADTVRTHHVETRRGLEHQLSLNGQ